MRTASVSTLSLMNTPRSNVARMQNDLVRLNQEVVTGRMADVGLNLGAEAARSVTLHVDTRMLDGLARSNATLTNRLQQSQSALDVIRTGADSFLNDLMTARATTSVGPVVQSARNGLASFLASINASDGQNRLFGGTNSGVAPLAQYNAGPGAAVDAAFQTSFGFAPGDPAASGISGAAMTTFLDTAFAQLFGDPDWGTTWSNASDQPISSRISLTEKIDSSVSANEPAMRKLAEVYTMVGYLGMDTLGADARQAILDKAITLIGGASAGIVDLQVNLGAMQNRVGDATDRISAQQTMLEAQIGRLEGVDPAEAKIRIDTLTTQIQMSYSLTARLLQMSILNFA